MLSAALLAVGCNGILGNEDRSFVGNTTGGESASGGMDSTTGSSGEGGLAGMAPDSGGAAGAAGAGDGGEAGEAGEAAESSGTNGVGGVGGASTASDTNGSNTTGEPCECIVGTDDSLPEPCGNCGTATRTRTCEQNCQWSEYGEPSACMNEGPCVPNTPEQVTGHCENGGWRYDTRTCGGDCQWGDWTRGGCEYGQNGCSGCACMSDCISPAPCLWIDCDEAAARAECAEDADFVCGTATWEFIEWLPN